MARMHSFSTSALPSAIVSATSSVTSAITSATSAVTSATSAIASAVPTLPSAAPTALLSAILTALPALLLIRAASGQPDGYPIIEYPNCPITGQRPENIETAYIEASGVGPASIGAAVWQRRCTTEDNMTCCGLCGGEELALRYIRSNVSLAISALGANATAAARKLIDLSNPPSACEALQGYPLCAHLLEMVMCTAVCDADTEFVVEAGPTITICDGLAERLKAECAGTLFGRITITMDAYSFTTQLLTAIGRNLYGIPSFSAVISFSGGCLSGPPTDDAFPPTTTCCDPFTLHPSHCPPSSLPNPQTEPHPSSPLSPQPPTDLNRSNSNTSSLNTYIEYLNRDINVSQCMAAEPYAYPPLPNPSNPEPPVLPLSFDSPQPLIFFKPFSCATHTVLCLVTAGFLLWILIRCTSYLRIGLHRASIMNSIKVGDSPVGLSGREFCGYMYYRIPSDRSA